MLWLSQDLSTSSADTGFWDLVWNKKDFVRSSNDHLKSTIGRDGMKLLVISPVPTDPQTAGNRARVSNLIAILYNSFPVNWPP